MIGIYALYFLIFLAISFATVWFIEGFIIICEHIGRFVIVTADTANHEKYHPDD